MRWLIGAYISSIAGLVVFSAVAAAVVAGELAPDDRIDRLAAEHSYNLASWELRHFPEKWLYKIGSVLRDNDKPGADEDVLERYFNLTNEIRAIVNEDPNSPGIAPKEQERAFLENSVESIIEGRVTSILEEQGLTLEAPLFSDIGMVWPPVDFEFEAPPRVLVVSPRDRIELLDDYLLEPGLVNDTVGSIEQEAESGGDISALVVQSGGVATYPSVTSDLRTYDSLIPLVFHEWTHQYLSFYPLGFRFFRSADTRTLNETVATIAGDELGALYFEKYGQLDLRDVPSPATAPAPSVEPFDFTEEMRALRREVEALLAEGKIEEAETMMDEKRDEFEAKGVYIRKLNQAYFAFYGFYGTSGGSIDPIGPKLQKLFAESGSPGEFLHRARGITSRDGLDAALASG